MSGHTTLQAKVREFTVGARGQQPNKPKVANKEAVDFIVKMVISELYELMFTHRGADEEGDDVHRRLQLLVGDIDGPTTPIASIHDTGSKVKLLSHEVEQNKKLDANVQVISAQQDALVDAMYYMADFATRHGFNIDKVFDVVHEANMNKKFPDGKFHLRADGKIVKPPGWVEGNVDAEIVRQLTEGSWDTEVASCAEIVVSGEAGSHTVDN